MSENRYKKLLFKGFKSFMETIWFGWPFRHFLLSVKIIPTLEIEIMQQNTQREIFLSFLTKHNKQFQNEKIKYQKHAYLQKSMQKNTQT